MNKLYDINLFQTKLSFLNKKCSMMLQFYIQNSSGSNLRCGIAKTGDKKESNLSDIYFLFGIDITNHVITPINGKYIREILSIIKKLDIDQKIKDIFFNIDADINVNEDATALKFINDNLFIFVSSSELSSELNSITISCLDDNKTRPLNFCFYASDGLDLNVYIELAQITYDPYAKYHLLDGIKIFMNYEFMGEYYPDNLINDNGKIKLMCRLFNNKLFQDSSFSKFNFDNLNVFDIMYFTARMAGLSDDSIKFPPEYKQSYNWYTVIIPINNLSVESEFGIGNVRLLKHTNGELKEFQKHLDSSPIISKSYSKVYINEYNFYNAYVKAKKQIEQSMDLLINIARDDSIYSNHSVATQIIDKDLSYFSAKPELDTWCYIENSFYEKKVIFNSKSIATKSELIISNSTLIALNDCEKIELMMIKLAESEDKNTLPLFNALKWIRKAWDSTDEDDQIIYSIIALEFVVSGEKGEPLIERTKRKLIKKDLENSIRSRYKVSDNLENLILKVLDKFDYAYSDTPFFVKLQKLIERLEIPLQDNYIKLIRTARDKRNDIIHGRNSETISYYDIKRLCEIVSQITFCKISSMEVK